MREVDRIFLISVYICSIALELDLINYPSEGTQLCDRTSSPQH